MVIRRTDRVEEVLGVDGRMIEAFIAASPVFRGLRNPLLRRTMGRLATVEQAARVAGIDPDLLAERLNRARSGATLPTAASAAGGENELASPERNTTSSGRATAPAGLASVAAEQIVDLDVREDLRNGREPFSRIMAARREVPAGGVLRVRAIFEPVPLYAVMARQGFDRWTEELGVDDWRVWFYPAQPEEEAPAVETASPLASGEPQPFSPQEDAVIVLDVRGMEPPEPMVRTLAALEELPRDATLLQINERVPQFLLPRLAQLGFSYEVLEQSDALVRIFIRRRNES